MQKHSTLTWQHQVLAFSKKYTQEINLFEATQFSLLRTLFGVKFLCNHM